MSDKTDKTTNTEAEQGKEQKEEKEQNHHPAPEPEPYSIHTPDLPDGWEMKMSRNHGKPYYINTYKGTTQWDYPTEPAEKPDNADEMIFEVRAAHILVKHAGSRRPSSWREEVITRTKEEAVELIEEYQQRIGLGQNTFEEIASEFSDCASAKNGGDLGKFKRGIMQKPFEEAAFALEVGGISGPVESDSGIHLIKRIA